jgi:serine/threonine-protein kinase
MQAIKGYNTFIKIEPLHKGWSNDKKYYIETEKGKHLCLRVADVSQYERKKFELTMIKKLTALGIPLPQPVDFGICDCGKSVYLLLTWCDGEDARTALPSCTNEDQYAIGFKSGEILKKIHSIFAPKEQEEWSSRFNRKINIKIRQYNGCGIRFDGDDKIIKYIKTNRYLLTGRPQCYQHGDYHVGNFIISPGNLLAIIDFDRSDFGDPWEEFNRIVWSASVSPHFATGQLNGYFNGKPPSLFFKLLAFYVACNTLSSIYWAIPFGQNEINNMLKQAQEVLRWFDNMNNSIPTWYLDESNTNNEQYAHI